MHRDDEGAVEEAIVVYSEAIRGIIEGEEGVDNNGGGAFSTEIVQDGFVGNWVVGSVGVGGGGDGAGIYRGDGVGGD